MSRQTLRADAVYGPKSGDTVEYLGSRDPDPHSPVGIGDVGQVVVVDAIGTIHVSWKSGSTLGLIPGIDQWRVVRKSNRRTQKKKER